MNRRKSVATPAPAPDKPQQVTRIPPYRPGMWVKLKVFEKGDPFYDISGKIKQVKSLTCSITQPDQKNAVWRVHFMDGRAVEWRLVERVATVEETARTERSLRGGH